MKPVSRREMLAATPVIGSSVAQTLMAAESSAQTPDGKKIIVTGGHPGDPEYGCGGTIARYADLGHEIVLLYLNEGDPPEKTGPKRVRVGEAAKACEIL